MSTVSAGTTWDRNTEQTPVYAVVSAVAEATGTDVLELPPLTEAINPDALNALFTSRPDTTVECVRFRYAGHTIVIAGSGDVRVHADE